MAKLPEEVSTAIAIAESTPGWSVSARNGKIVIVAPDGTALTTSPKPNDESLKVWRAQAAKYNLIGDGPAMTPKQQEEMAMATATQIDPLAEKKAAEAAEAAKKAALAIAGKGPTPGAPKTNAISVPVVTFTAPAAPVATPKVIATAVAKKAVLAAQPAVDEDGFPPFAPSMLVTEQGSYIDFQIKSGTLKGRYFCGLCWERGDKETFKAPQGLASHRGFRHAAFMLPGADSQGSAKLPEAIDTALELLRGALIEELTDTADAGQLRILEKQVKELNGVLQAKDAALQTKDIRLDERGKMLTELEGTLRTVVKERDAAVKLAEERGTALDKARAEYEAQVKMLLSRVEKDLQQMQTWANELAPVKAVGQIMNIIERYLNK
jgi:hypothetical protein